MTANSISAEARRAYLIAIRKGLGITQAEMARALGMSIRSYSDLETGASSCRTVHILAAERVTLRQAVIREDADILANPIRADIRSLVSLI